MDRIYKIGNRRFSEITLERMYHVLDELRLNNVYDIERYIVLTTCMEELTKRSKWLKALAEKAERMKHENCN